MNNKEDNQILLPHHHSQDEEKIKAYLPGEEEIAGVSEALKQLGDPSRLRIFWLLCHCEECVLNIAAIVNMTSPAVSHHLRLLKSSGLIVSRREGKRDVLPDCGYRAGTDASSHDRKAGEDHLSQNPRMVDSNNSADKITGR